MMRAGLAIGASLLAPLMIPGVARADETTSKPVEKIAHARVNFKGSCENFEGRVVPKLGTANNDDGGIVVTGSLITALPIVADLIGDLAGAGLNALSAAIREASKAKAIGGEGTVDFEFYRLNRESGKFVPALGDNQPNACLVLTIDGNHRNLPFGIENWPPPGYKVTGDMVENSDGTPLDEGEARRLRATFEPRFNSKLVVELGIVRLRDGFYLEPRYVAYNTALKGSSKSRALPAEIQLSFETPTPKDASVAGGTVFAVSRIKLPPLKPGDIWWQDQMGVRGALLPFRPRDGATTTLEAKLTPYTTIATAREAIAIAYVKMIQIIGMTPRAGNEIRCLPIGCPDWLKESGDDYKIDGVVVDTVDDVIKWALGPKSKLGTDAKKALVAADADRKTNRDKLDQEKARLDTTFGVTGDGADDSDSEGLSAKDYPTGSTSVTARIVLIKDENKFGTAIASALSKQQQPLTDFVKAKVYSPEPPEWTVASSQYAVALATAQQAQAAYDAAVVGGDATVTGAAKVTLIQDQADANLKAVAASKSLPYPQLGQ